MNIVQTYWSKPTLAGHNKSNRLHGGWLSERYQYMSMALSCLLLQRHCGPVTLYTDKHGYDLLIKILKLPYDKVNVCLDVLNVHPASLWALPKLFVYQLQKEPFIHVDTDVFVWRPFTKKQLDAALLVQSPEIDFEMYIDALEYINGSWIEVPVILKKPAVNDSIPSINAGVFGGNDIEFIQKYTQIAFAIVEQNKNALKEDSATSGTNIIIEQYLFSRLADSMKKNIEFVIPTLDKELKEVLGFNKLPLAGYIHLMGETKQRLYACHQVEYRLAYEFPKTYKTLVRKLKKSFKNCTPAERGVMPIIDKIDKYSLVSSNFKNTFKWLSDNNMMHKYENQHILNSAITELCAKLNPPIAQFVNEQYQIEQLASYLWGKKSSVQLSRVRSLRKLYRRLDNANEKDVMSWPLSISKDINIFFSNWYAGDFTSVAPDKVRKDTTDTSNNLLLIERESSGVILQDLKGQHQLLVYFQQPCTGNQLAILLANETNDNNGIERIYSIIYEFITMHLIYTGYLRLI